MSQNHTAGPWSVAKGCDQYVGSDGKWIASTMGIRGAEGAANARLIAAAPDLLAALEHILAGALSLPRFAEEEARAAISKAKASSS